MAKTRTLGPGTFSIGDGQTSQNWAADVTQITVTPDTSTEDSINYLDGSSEGGAQTTNWTIEGTIKEDYSTTGLQKWCLDHAGETLPFTFVPNNTADLQITGNATVAPVAFGGEVKAKNDIDFSFAATDVQAGAKPTGE